MFGLMTFQLPVFGTQKKPSIISVVNIMNTAADLSLRVYVCNSVLVYIILIISSHDIILYIRAKELYNRPASDYISPQRLQLNRLILNSSQAPSHHFTPRCSTRLPRAEV